MKKINTHAKGLRTQRKAKAYLLCHDYKMVWFINHSRFSKDIIIEGCPFDGFAINKTNDVVFIQVKTNCYPEVKHYEHLGIKWMIMVWWDKGRKKGWAMLPAVLA